MSKIRILFSFLVIFTLSNCSTLINRMAWGPSAEIQFIEKIPFEIPPFQKLQPTKDFSFAYKLGEFSEEVESIMYTDIKDNSEVTWKQLFTKKVPTEIKDISGRTQGKQKTTYTNKILETRANGDYLLSTTWVGKEKSNCETQNLNESLYDKNSNFLVKKKSIYNCKEYKTKPDNEPKSPIYKFDDLLLDTPVYRTERTEKETTKIEIRFIGIANYKNREVAVIINRIDSIANQCLPDNFLFGKNNKCLGEGNELIYLDLKSKVPLLRKNFTTVTIEKEKSFSMLDPFGILDDLFPTKMQSQAIHTYTYPASYLEN